MTGEKYDSTLEQLKDVESFFVPGTAERLKQAGLKEIDQVDQFVAWLFASESLRELGLKRQALSMLADVGVETVGDLLVIMTKKKDLPKFLR